MFVKIFGLVQFAFVNCDLAKKEKKNPSKIFCFDVHINM